MGSRRMRDTEKEDVYSNNIVWQVDRDIQPGAQGPERRGSVRGAMTPWAGIGTAAGGRKTPLRRGIFGPEKTVCRAFL